MVNKHFRLGHLGALEPGKGISSLTSSLSKGHPDLDEDSFDKEELLFSQENISSGVDL